MNGIEHAMLKIQLANIFARLQSFSTCHGDLFPKRIEVLVKMFPQLVALSLLDAWRVGKKEFVFILNNLKHLKLINCNHTYAKLTRECVLSAMKKRNELTTLDIEWDSN